MLLSQPTHRTPRTLPTLTTFVALGLLSLTIGCLSLDDESVVYDLRILAVKTEPPEILLPAALASTGGGPGGPPGTPVLPSTVATTPVTVEVFVFDPRDGTVTVTTSLCPPGEDNTCVGFDPTTDVVDDVADEALKQERRAVFVPAEAEVVHAPTNAEPMGKVDAAPRTLLFTDSVLRALTTNATGVASVSLSPLDPKIVITTTSDATADGVAWASSYKRLPMLWDVHDPALNPVQLNVALAPFGVRLCQSDDVEIIEPMIEERVAACLRPRVANTNPVLVGFELVDGADDQRRREALEEIPPVVFRNTAPLGPHPVLLVPAGERLRIRPVFSTSSRESYQALVRDPNDGTTIIEDRFEDFVANWFVTRGDVSGETRGTDGGGFGGGPPGGADEQPSIDGVWTLPTEAEIGGVEDDTVDQNPFAFFQGPPADEDPVDVDVTGVRDTLVVVFKDQRGGVAVGRIVVEYQP